MIYSRKQAKKLKRQYTIDLKAIMAENYLDSKKTFMQNITKSSFKTIGIVGVFLYILISLVGWGVIVPQTAKAA